ncbi:hypothetical protein FQN54_002325 [Arachnomyces sp. PD_36]|nr:hypothetical protein FQN54_002325 [Arachnomyces sp. PD_36]
MSQPPIPGSAEDKLDMNEIRATYELLPVVAELRANPDFAELEPDDREEASEEEKGRYLQAGPMAGSRGLAIRRTFWNEKEKLAASIVFFGPGLEGWPSFVHGGAISVVLDERLGRVALRIFPERDGVTANLNIDYRAPVISGNFYTVYAKYDAEKSTERKAYVDGTILDIAGNLCAEATGLFVVPKNFKPSQLNKHGSA